MNLSRGHVHLRCCQKGIRGHSSGGWIALQPGRAFPPDLAAAWTGADIQIYTDGLGRQTVNARVMFGNEAEAAERFQHSLDDWLRGTLDPTGDAYRMTDLRQHRPPSRPRLDILPVAPTLRAPVAPGPVLSR